MARSEPQVVALEGVRPLDATAHRKIRCREIWTLSPSLSNCNRGRQISRQAQSGWLAPRDTVSRLHKFCTFCCSQVTSKAIRK